MADETPEQQLLKLIEQPQAGGAAAATDAKADAGAQPKVKKGLSLQSLLTPSGWKGLLSYAKEQGVSFVRQKPEIFSLRKFNYFFKAVMVAAGVLMLAYLIYSAHDMKSEFDSLSDVTQKEMADLPISGGRMLEPSFFEDIAKRNIFAPIVKKAEPEMLDNTMTKAKLLEMTKDIKLTGISVNPTDPSRTFCMIEDLKKNNTSFLKIGDSINGFTIANIEKDSVELKYQNESIDLR